ncbi:hypothetical protein [Leptospira sp. GIMC2001]|uniref:hypothetical protein n=1 Tax=Leptospira sp. GIMC2001 TaxID=1513297 RepID=UPI00234AD73E|nr:hypothetical protein [Leptospira sp. GIMC2001]WCL50335.1 hypothetical protein O4O04_05810 [Leptospira sp. GIMC2001]
MDVRLSNLLNSAEKLVKDKIPASSDGQKGKEGQWSNPVVQDTAEFTNQLTGKYQTIQAKLSELQNNLTKEQMKQGLLAEKAPDPAELIHILFGKEPLFSELQQDANADLDKIRLQSGENILNIEKEIRTKEVENENVVSLGMTHNPKEFSKALEGIDRISWKPLNEKTVQKLIQ